jgi:hypothetical protein
MKKKTDASAAISVSICVHNKGWPQNLIPIRFLLNCNLELGLAVVA